MSSVLCYYVGLLLCRVLLRCSATQSYSDVAYYFHVELLLCNFVETQSQIQITRSLTLKKTVKITEICEKKIAVYLKKSK